MNKIILFLYTNMNIVCRKFNSLLLIYGRNFRQHKARIVFGFFFKIKIYSSTSCTSFSVPLSVVSLVTWDVFAISRPFWKPSFLSHIFGRYCKNDIDILNHEKISKFVYISLWEFCIVAKASYIITIQWWMRVPKTIHVNKNW